MLNNHCIFTADYRGPIEVPEPTEKQKSMFIAMLRDINAWKSYGMVRFEDEPERSPRVKTLQQRVKEISGTDWDSINEIAKVKIKHQNPLDALVL